MPLASKIRVYRELKRMAAENRHLYACLLSHIDAQGLTRRRAAPRSSLYASRAPTGRKYLFTRQGEGRNRQYKTSFSVPLCHRCALTVGEASAASKEEAELGAMIAALAIAPSSAEWSRIMRVLDTDLFVAFVTLLTALNAYALIRVVRAQPERAGFAASRGSSAAGKGPQFRATVAAELASIDDCENVSIDRRHCIAPGNGPLRRDNDVDSQTQTVQSRQCERRYDVGVTGDWLPSALDAIKSALFKSLDLLQDHAVDEWRAAGQEGALLLNELSCGDCCTSEMDVCVLNSALRGGNVAVQPPCTAVDEGVVWRFRCDATSDHIIVTAAPEERALAESHIMPLCAPTENGEGTGCLSGTNLAPSAEFSRRVTTDEVHLPFSISAATIRRPFVGDYSYRSEPASKELQWPRRCLNGATLLLLAALKSSLYRSAASACSRHTLNYNAVLERASPATELCKSSVAPALEWTRAPFFSAFCDAASLPHGLFSPGEPWSVGSDIAQDTVESPGQNHWHCPDVVVMIASVRAALQLPFRSYPNITFEQTALHDPARRACELAQGLHGDVDVLTRVHVRWETSRGLLTACAVSDPALHHQNAIRSGFEESSCTQLSCADTGYPRGPLLLLVSAVCSLYDQVVNCAFNVVAGRYPVASVKNYLARGGLDFLLFSWFRASPQVRCFTIGTTPPSYVQLSNSEATSILRGPTRHELGHSMTRAMLFYDLLGQRVLFAETHATSAADAVARVNTLSVERNCVRIDFHALPSAVAQRPFRSVLRQRQWQRSREVMERTMQLGAAAADGAEAGKCASHHHYQAAAAAAMRACIRACASEVGALWTVLETAAKVAAGSDRNSNAKGLPGHRPLFARFMEDPSPTAKVFSGEDDSEDDRGWWLGSHGASWNCRALGKEAAPPLAGVMEVHLCLPTPLGAAATAGGKQTEATSVKFVVLRCRVDALRSENEVTRYEWSCEERVTEPLGRCCFPTLVFTTAKVVSGVFPALTLLCRRALEYISLEAGFAPLVSTLPPLSDVLAWCSAAAPTFHGALGGYPPYNARFYAAPKLLGELLQGAAGKYRCHYHILPPRGPIMNAVSGVGWGAGCAEAAGDEEAAAQPSTIFYTSKPIDVGAALAEDATRQHDSCLAKPLSVGCTLYLESLLGGRAASSLSAASPTRRALAATPFVLGHGVGHTKREAWRSAAWQALRLQFPGALAQLEAYRDASELLQRPAQLNRLLSSSGLNRGDVWGRVAPVIYKLRFDCSVPSYSSARTTAVASAAAVPAQAVHQLQCQVTAVRTDGSQVCVVPGCTATATSAGKAYTVAVTAVLRAVRGAAQEAAADASRVTMGTAPGHVIWASTWPSAPGSLSGAAQSPHPAPYSAWRETTHYGKSVWHAYAGALSAYHGFDVVVDLVSEDASADELGSPSRGVGGGGRLRCRAMLSKVRVRMSDWRAEAATAAGGADLRSTDQSSGTHRRITPFGALSDAVGGRTAGASVGDAADGILFERSADSLLACCLPLLGTGAYSTRADSVGALTRPHGEHFCHLLREITKWLRDITQQCALPLALREELRGLLLARACDLARIQDSYRWTPAERVEALLMWWVGRRVQVHIHRIDPSMTAASSSANQMAWVAEALVEIHGGRRRPGLKEQAGEFESREDTRRRLALPWVAARAIGTTSDEAAWQLCRRVCDALGDVVEAEPFLPSPERR
ncbi:hypothetical protein LSCM1_05511 [Leishmania martiniquensis]|uniref:Uncharacterized protein n=1 Tax=Leishmania martiniquensis TaxID=1580590 RepID=A0A836GYJ5_9TRYP|nr:hypothetical protein LSCM1_05511 [Leishmania martiniquensis]